MKKATGSSPPSTDAPAAAAPQVPAVPVRKLIIIGSVAFVLLASLGIGLWFYFSPPGVYIIDRFSKPHDELTTEIVKVGATLNNGMLDIQPSSGAYVKLLYQTPASDQATIEATAIWREGDESTMLGLVCCASSDSNFMEFLIDGNGN